MAFIDLSSLKQFQILDLVDALNDDGIIHALNGFSLRVAEDDAEAVRTAVDVMTRSGIKQDLEKANEILRSQPGFVRYDISEMESLARLAMFKQFDKEQIDFTLKSGILIADSSVEGRIEEIIRDSEKAVADLEKSQDLAREIKRGDRGAICDTCGSTPAASIDLRRQVGMVVVMKSYRAQAVLCEACADVAYKQFQKSTALKGWTGLRSAIMNPVVLSVNAINRNKHRRSLSD